jgi:hypothetical protein
MRARNIQNTSWQQQQGHQAPEHTGEPDVHEQDAEVRRMPDPRVEPGGLEPMAALEPNHRRETTPEGEDRGDAQSRARRQHDEPAPAQRVAARQHPEIARVHPRHEPGGEQGVQHQQREEQRPIGRVPLPARAARRAERHHRHHHQVDHHHADAHRMREESAHVAPADHHQQQNRRTLSGMPTVCRQEMRAAAVSRRVVI